MTEPQMYVDQSFHQAVPQKWCKSRRTLLFVIGVFILAEVIWSIYTLTRPVVLPGDPITQAENAVVPSDPAPAASVDLKGPLTAKVGTEFEVILDINSSSSVEGVDLLIKYDPAFFEVKNSLTPIKTGVLFPTYPVNSNDPTGLITLSGISPTEVSLAGENEVGVITFIAKKAGKNTISVDYVPDSSKDSNVIESKSGRDILNKVTPLEIVIN